MTTPIYKGQGQPPPTSGGWLSNWFGSATPAYKQAPTTPNPSTASTSPTATVPASASRRAFFGYEAPAYKLAPQPDDCTSVPQEFAIIVPRQALDPIEPQE